MADGARPNHNIAAPLPPRPVSKYMRASKHDPRRWFYYRGLRVYIYIWTRADLVFVCVCVCCKSEVSINKIYDDETPSVHASVNLFNYIYTSILCGVIDSAIDLRTAERA